MAASMTGRERVNKAFAREDHDRVPRHDTYWWETIKRWQDEGLDGDAGTVLYQHLGSDLTSIAGSWPAPFPGQNILIEEDEETRLVINQFGQKERQWKNRSGTPEHHGFCCETREDWFNDIKPRIEALGPVVDVDAAVEHYNKGRADEKWTYMAGVETFEQTRRLLGDETTMIAMATDPRWIADVSRTHTECQLKTFNALYDAGAHTDCLWIFGDMAFNHATMCSPAMYKELIWPDHKRLADWAHERGMKFIYHTDGDVNGVIDLYLEAGFDGLHPLESKANMDVRDLAPKYGDRLAFFGNIDVMKMGTNDLDIIEEEIRTKFAAAMATRSYIYHSDHSVPPQSTWQTYQAIIEMVKKYGQYDNA